MAGRIYVKIEAEFSGEGNGWTDITADVSQPVGIAWDRGLPGAGHLDRVGKIGQLTFALLNNTENSGGLDGYYTIGHVNQRAGWAKNIGIRASVVVRDADGWVEDSAWVDSGGWVEGNETEEPVFTGHLAKVNPQSGQYLAPRLAFVECHDYFGKLARHVLQPPVVGEGESEHDAFDQLIAEVDAQPRAIANSPGPDSYDFVFDLVRQDTRAIGVLQDLCQSSYATAYVRGDGTLVREARNEKRAMFGASLTPAHTLTESDIRNRTGINSDDATDEITNSVQVEIIPREVDRSESPIPVVYSSASPIEVGDGDTIEVCGLFTDENNDRTGAVDVQALVSGTDYVFNSEPDGSGTNETANVTVTAASTTNSIVFTITNNAGKTVHATTLQAKAYPLIAQEHVIAPSEDATSIGDIGRNDLVFRMPYQARFNVAAAFSAWFLDTGLDDERKLRSVPWFLDPQDTDRVRELLAAEISDVFAISETMTALDGSERFFINQISGRTTPEGHVWMEWLPAPADSGPFVEFAAEVNARHLTTGGSTNKDQTVWTTAKVTPEEDRLLLLWLNYGTGLTQGDPSPNPQAPTVTGCGLTWTKIEEQQYTTSDNKSEVSLYRAMGTPTAGKLTITFPANHTRCSWSLLEFDKVTTGANGANAVVQSDAADSATINLAAFAGFQNRPAVGGGPVAGVEAIALESGWTEGGKRTGTSALITGWKEDGEDTSAQILNLSNYGIAAVELSRENVAGEELTTDGSTTPGTGFATASITPQADALVLAWVASEDSSGGDPPKPTLSGNGLTWVEVNDVIYDGTGGVRSRLVCFRAQGAAPSAGAVSITYGSSQDECTWSVVQFAKVPTTGANGADAVVQSQVANVQDEGSIAVALNDFADVDENRAALGVALNRSDTITEKSTWRQLGQHTTNTSMLTAYNGTVADQDASATIDGATGHAGAIAVEVASIL